MSSHARVKSLTKYVLLTEIVKGFILAQKLTLGRTSDLSCASLGMDRRKSERGRDHTQCT